MNPIRSAARSARRSALRLAAASLCTGLAATGALALAPAAGAAVLSPSNVTGLAVNGTALQVQWRDNSSSEVRYSVRLTDQTTFQLLQFTANPVAGSGSTGALTITDLAPGRTYKPTVCSLAGAGTFTTTCAQGATISLGGSASTTPPPPPPPPAPAAVRAPSGVTTARVGASTVRVNWNHNSGARSFRIFVRVAAGGNWMLASTEPGTARTTTVAPLLINTGYQLAVCAVNTNDQNICSGVVGVFLPQGF